MRRCFLLSAGVDHSPRILPVFSPPGDREFLPAVAIEEMNTCRREAMGPTSTMMKPSAPGSRFLHVTDGAAPCFRR